MMEALKVDFSIVPADLDELKIGGSDPSERVKKIALAKADAIRQLHPDSAIVAADTYLVLKGLSLEKPADLNEARQMLHAQSGQTAICYTGFCYQFNGITDNQTAEIKVVFRHFSSAEIDRYVEENPVLTWSAAFCPAYAAGLSLVATIDGSLTGFTHGLPVELLVPHLKQDGFLF
jgi:septum formation protein